MSKTRKSNYKFSDREMLELYLARHSEIKESRLVKNGFNLSLRISEDNQRNLTINCSEVDEDDLRSFLTIYRKFISEESPFFLYKVFNICQQHIKNEDIRAELTEVRKNWGNQLKFGIMKLNINEEELSPEYLSNLWLNAVYFHDDIEKIQTLEKLMQNDMSYIFIRHNFLSHVLQTTNYILFVGNVVKCCFRDGYFDSSI